MKNIYLKLFLAFLLLLSVSFVSAQTEETAFPIDSLNQIIDNSTDTIPTQENTPVISNTEEQVQPFVNQDSLNIKPPKMNRGIEISFAKSELKPESGEILSNVLKIVNHNTEAKIILPEYNHPASWKLVGQKDVWYEIQANDTIYVPVRIIPQAIASGQSNYQINVFIYNDKGIQILTDHFNCVTDKTVQWNVQNSDDKIYFKHGENWEDLSFNISNTSVFPQEIFMTTAAAKGSLALSRDGEELEEGESSTFQLDSFEDTTFTYTATIDNLRRNFRRVSLLGHIPNRNNQTRRYSVYMNTQETKSVGQTDYRNGSKIDLIKLANVLRATEYSSNDLPLDVQANYQNILGDFPFLSINMNGYKNLNNDASLNYFTQLNYNQVFWNAQNLGNIPWYLGYFSREWTAQAGNINGGIVGMPAVGKGVKGSYFINPQHEVGGFFTSSKGFLQTGHTDSYGIHYQYNFPNNGFVMGKLGRYTNGLNGTSGNVLSVQSSYRLAEKHSIGAFGGFSTRNFLWGGIMTPQTGGLFGLNYTSRFLENKLFVNVGGRYNSKFFGNSTTEILTSDAKVQYEISNKWSVFYSGNYANIDAFNPATAFFNPFSSYDFFQNRVVFTTTNRWGTFNPGLYYNFNKFFDYNVQARGLSLRFSRLNYLKNTLLSFYSEAGYTDNRGQSEIGDYFNFRMNMLYRIRTLTLTSNYRYGANNKSAQDYQTATGQAPQLGRISASHQYLFNNQHWILETNTSYTYNNRFKSQFLGIFPELFYFSNSGWRYSINPGYTVSITNYNADLLNLYQNVPINSDDVGSNVNKGFRLNVSARKTFGIPIPFVKPQNSNISYNTFYDLNGNDVQDKGETAVPNVVLKLNDYEVLTNDNGFALIENLPHETYYLQSFPLEDMQGWFAKVPDSLVISTDMIIQIPFVRGVKVMGDVILNRQEIAVTDERPFDLSNIRVSANDGNKVYSTLTNFDGSFDLYLPNGNYTLTIDENILGDKYSLLQNNIELDLNSEMENVYTSFYIVEKERKVKVKKFGSQGTIIKRN
ncbi:MAG: hypothetical protein AAF487_00670 [Bacteroidota bacterium]